MTPYAIIAGLVLWLASVVGVGYWQRQDGITVTAAAYAKRDNKELVEINNKLKTTEEAYRKLEHQAAERQAAISATYQEQLKNANQKTADLIIAARAGTFRLRDPASLQAGGHDLPKTAASSGGRDATCDGGLSADSTEFLLALTGRCNQTRDQLTACQSVVIADRELSSAE